MFFYKRCGKCCNIKGKLRLAIIGPEYFCLHTMKAAYPDGYACSNYNKITENASRNYLKLKPAK